MLPWGHAAVGYLCYRLYTFLSYRRPPTGVAVVALAIGTQFPDLIDKPLAWEVSVLPSGRSFGHSLLVLAIVVGLLYWWRRDSAERTRTALFGFGFGWTTHVFADAYPILFGRQTCVNYLVWPLAACPYDEADRSIIEYLLAVELADGALFGVGLTVFAGAIWLYDGAPGLWYLLRRGKAWFQRKGSPR